LALISRSAERVADALNRLEGRPAWRGVWRWRCLSPNRGLRVPRNASPRRPRFVLPSRCGRCGEAGSERTRLRVPRNASGFGLEPFGSSRPFGRRRAISRSAEGAAGARRGRGLRQAVT